MANLTRTSFLNGFDHTIGETRLFELTDLELVSIATPLGGKTALTKTLKDAFGASMPSATKSTVSKDKKIRFVSTQPDQFLAVIETGNAKLASTVMTKTSGYTTLQSHGMVGLCIDGSLARDALMRMCQIDVHKDVFKLNATARTAMEHMGATLIRTGADRFVLLSASSSAASFLHAVETSLKNVNE